MRDFSSMYVAKWEDSDLEREDAAVWDFEDFAKNARGIKRLGILRMDVDNLGTIFIKGLRFPKRRTNNPEGPSGQGWGRGDSRPIRRGGTKTHGVHFTHGDAFQTAGPFLFRVHSAPVGDIRL